VREENGKVTDFLSFYSLPSSVLGNDKHKTLYAAYSYYNVANTVSLKQLMSDALVLAKQKGYDVFNALNLMDNNEFLEVVNKAIP
ncbi:glycylpeptide N-tetradecanoyltransferase, partial [Perkinsus olseni]